MDINCLSSNPWGSPQETTEEGPALVAGHARDHPCGGRFLQRGALVSDASSDPEVRVEAWGLLGDDGGASRK